jgi:hypothetical protein
MKIYEYAAPIYKALGWSQTTPAQEAPESKKPALGIHHVFGRYPEATIEQMESWQKAFPERNCLLRMPRGVIGIDIDHYWKQAKNGTWIRKQGFDNIQKDFSRFGELPPTFSSTSRGPSQASRILFYRVDDDIRFASAPYQDVEIIQHTHRYAVVWPSVHPETNAEYKWYNPAGEETTPPRPGDLTKLPDEWIPPLTDARASRSRTGPGKGTPGHLPYKGTADHWMNSLDDSEMSMGTSLLLSEFLNRSRPHVGHNELLSLIGRLHWLQFSCGEFGARRVFEVIVETYLEHTNELDPYTELFNIIRYVAGEDFLPCTN